jgi:hypothetical protein
MLTDLQRMNRQLLRKTKDTNTSGGWSLKFTFNFMVTTHEPLHLDKSDFLSERSWICLQVLFEPLFSVADLLNMAMARNFEVMLEQTLKHSV